MRYEMSFSFCCLLAQQLKSSSVICRSSSHNKFNNNAFYAHCVRTSLLLRNNNRLYNLLSRHKSLSLAVSRRQQFCWVEHILSSQFKISLVHQLSLLWLHEHITYTYWSDYLILYILNVRHGNERKCGMAACVLQPEFLLFTLCSQLEAISLLCHTLLSSVVGRLTEWPIWWSQMSMCDIHVLLKVKFF